MAIEVVPYSSAWPYHFETVARALRTALEPVPLVAIEHVGSTSVPGLAAKPILDIDVIVTREHVAPAIAALAAAGYTHQGDLGVADREAFAAPDTTPPRHVYLCVDGTLHVRNHLAVREVLRSDPKLRERYAAVKWQLASDPGMDIGRYIAGKSAVLQEVLAAAELSEQERAEILRLNAL